MVQMWKGQYGFLLVGAEIGLYTAPSGKYTGSVGDVNHYDCAAKEDWLYMQLDCYFAKNNSGKYEKIFTRPYDKYWWPTGFVFGQLADKKDSDPLRVLCRITFNEEGMANAFAEALAQEGFSSVSKFDPTVKDTFKIHGNDVIFIWQDVR